MKTDWMWCSEMPHDAAQEMDSLIEQVAELEARHKRDSEEYQLMHIAVTEANNKLAKIEAENEKLQNHIDGLNQELGYY